MEVDTDPLLQREDLRERHDLDLDVDRPGDALLSMPRGLLTFVIVVDLERVATDLVLAVVAILVEVTSEI